jgi:hypothetical protein
MALFIPAVTNPMTPGVLGQGHKAPGKGEVAPLGDG